MADAGLHQCVVEVELDLHTVGVALAHVVIEPSGNRQKPSAPFL